MCIDNTREGEQTPSTASKMASNDLPDCAELKATIANINEPQSRETNLKCLREIGGASGLAGLLQTNVETGVSPDEVATRREVYGCNSLPASPRKSWFQLFVDTFDDDTLQILIVAAVVSLAVGIYDDPTTGYIEGVAILAAVLIVSVVTACNDYQKETQFRELSKANDEVDNIVIRGGKVIKLPTAEIVLGDIVHIEAGDSIPCDGLLIRTDSLEVDESALTGEPIDIEKDLVDDPFLLSGCIATAGTATFIAIAVGKDSQWGVIKAHLEKEQDDTPLQEKLDYMAGVIGNVGTAAAVATFIAMMAIKIFVKPEYLDDVTTFGHALDAFIIGVTIVVVAVPEGLPLAVTIALSYSTKKMLADNNLIRHLDACETMGNATNICSDKTGTLTENRMTVVKGIFANVAHEDTAHATTSANISKEATEIVLQGIATCSTARILDGPKTDTAVETECAYTRYQVVGNKTEAALLLLAQSPFFDGDDHAQRRADANFGNPGGSRLFPFSSKRKRMSVLVNKNNEWTLHHKGAGEIVLKQCSSYLDADGSIKPMSDAKRKELENTISTYASDALRCVAIAHRANVGSLLGNPETATVEDCEKNCEHDMVLDALVGIVDPLRDDVVDAVKTCQDSGIFVRMVTGDNLETAIAIAKQAGILTGDGLSMIGEEFRKLTPAQLDEILPKLQVLARSSPEDKHILVGRLNGALMPKTKEEWMEAHPGKDFETEKDLLLPGYYDEWAASRNGVGEVVGVTGDGTNDGPALKAADVGLSMGISGTDVAKNASDIIIMDDNFSSIVKSVLWGRSVFDNIRKFLQFQLTVNVVALSITFLSAVVGYKPPLNAVMMLWVNLIMDTMGALALGTEPPSPDLLGRRPYKRDASLITLPMWRNIFIQSSYQLGLLIFLLMRGPEIFNCENGTTHHFTIIFNAFVFCQVFNEFNAREIGDVFSPFKKLNQSPMFLAVVVFTVGAQWFIVEYGGDFTQTSRLSLDEWKITCALGAVTIPVGLIMRLIPVNEDPDSFSGLETSEPKKASNSGMWLVAAISAAIIAVAVQLGST